MAAPVPPEPIVRTDEVQQIAADFVIIPDHGDGLVPNIGLIGGERAVLVVDRGMGPKNAGASWPGPKSSPMGDGCTSPRPTSILSTRSAQTCSPARRPTS